MTKAKKGKDLHSAKSEAFIGDQRAPSIEPEMGFPLDDRVLAKPANSLASLSKPVTAAVIEHKHLTSCSQNSRAPLHTISQDNFSHCVSSAPCTASIAAYKQGL